MIALVITIIVLLILAGVSIASLAGEGGILNKATRAETQNNQATIEEEIKLAYSTVQMDGIMNGWDINKKAEELQKELRIQDTKAEVIAVETTLEITYKEYEVVIYDDGKIEVEDPTKEKPQITITNLTTENNVESVQIKVKATTSEGQIEEIESMDGLRTLENTSESEKIFEAVQNGTYYFKAKGDNGRTVKGNIKINNVIVISESILEAISKITESGEHGVKVEGTDIETYFFNVINHKGNLVLDGETEADGVIPVNKIYEFGSEKDVGTASENARNTVVLKVDGDLTIQEGVTLISVASTNGYGGPKGMIIYCTGKLTNKGTITMTARGAKAEGQNVYLWKNSDESYEYIPAIGANGGTSVAVSNQKWWSAVQGLAGSVGTGRKTGGGGSGSSASADRDGCLTSGRGSLGTSYAGGSGGGRNKWRPKKWSFKRDCRC